MTVIASENYWNVVFEELQKEIEENGKAKYLLISKKYKQVIDRIEERIRFFYGKHATDNKISLKLAYRKLDKEQLERFKDLIEQYIRFWDNQKVSEKDTENEDVRENRTTLFDSTDWVETLKAYQNKSDITQYEELLVPIIQEIEIASKDTSDILAVLLLLTGWNVYDSITKQYGVKQISQDKIKQELSKAWAADDLALYERLNINKAKLSNAVKLALITGFKNDTPLDDMVEEVSKIMNIGANAAKRLVVTENTFFNSYGSYLALKDVGFEEYKYFSRLLPNTCEDCRSLHGSVFPLEMWEAGVTAPPLHPSCVCYTKPVLGGK